jgi:hypothetical protein
MSRVKKIQSRLSVRPMGRSDTGNEMFCKSYIVNGFSSFSELMMLRARYSAYYPGCTVLFSLDDRQQMEYTAFHSANSRSLDNEDIDFDESVSDMNPMPSTYFSFRLRRFLDEVLDVDFEKACATGLQREDGDDLGYLAMSEQPLLCIESEVAMIIVPVDDPSLGFCAMPVGYFTCDCGPFENYAIAKHFDSNYGYRLIGVGACMLGFIREDDLSDELINSMVTDLARVYHCEACGEFSSTMTSIIRNKKHLFIKYTDSIN